MAYVRYPSCRHGHVSNPSAKSGYADSATATAVDVSHPIPFLRGWVGCPIWLKLRQ
jgi:hypothetical protein